MVADDDRLLALLDRALATAPVEPAAGDVAFQRRLVLERRAAPGRRPFSRGLRAGVGLGFLTLGGLVGVAAAGQDVLPGGGTSSSTTAVPPAASVPPVVSTTPPPPPSVGGTIPASGTAPTSPPRSTPTTAPATTAGTTATTFDDNGGRSGNSGSGSSGSGRSGPDSSGSDSSGSDSSGSGS